VFVADSANRHIKVLTPQLQLHGVVGEGYLDSPYGVCANDDVIVVAERWRCAVCVFTRADGGFSHEFGAPGQGDGELKSPLGLCFVADHTAIAVVEYGNNRVSVFRVDGTFVRHVGSGVLRSPRSVACSDCDELVVADGGNCRIAIFSAAGELLKTLQRSLFTSVAISGNAMFTHTYGADRERYDDPYAENWHCMCVVFV
jgi:tripartite motif-containing protein 2/3